MPIDVEQSLKICEAAEPAPWRYNICGALVLGATDDVYIADIRGWARLTRTLSEGDAAAAMDANGLFIAHARAGYPLALRRIQELEKQLAAARAERDAAIAELAEVDKPCAICNRRVRDAIGVDWCAACDADERYRDAKEANDVLALQVARLTEDVAYLKNRADRMHDERTKRIVKLSDEVKELKRALTPDTEAT